MTGEQETFLVGRGGRGVQCVQKQLGSLRNTVVTGQEGWGWGVGVERVEVGAKAAWF